MVPNLPIPAAALALLNPDLPSTLSSLQQRYSAYLATEICSEISEHDDMFAEPYVPPGSLTKPRSKMEHYMFAGRSAIELIALAMACTLKERFSSVLDLPCGGGRVTRHLKAFLPDARLFVGDLDKRKERFVTATFGATSVDPGADFGIPEADRFDLIFVGSLLTHFGANQYQRALRWFIDALAPRGLLIFTTHGRRTFHKRSADFQSAEWREGVRGYVETGFGYRPSGPTMPMDGPSSYGTSLSAPHWVARLVESDPEVRLVHLAEGAWADNQDAVVLQKRPLTGE
ncbi:MAG: methyltransferase domain-containing protein [Stellaceae bacterium]